MKRQETTPDSTVESLYKKIHPISENGNKKNQAADHCINLLRIILKELVPWELWDTPYSELLVRILAKKLNMFIENTISNPIWLNDRLLTILNVEENVTDENIKEQRIDDRIQEKSGKVEQEIDKQKKETRTFEQEKDTEIQSAVEKKETGNTEATVKPLKSMNLESITESLVCIKLLLFPKLYFYC